MTRLALLVLLAGTDGGVRAKKYSIDPCSVLGRVDGGVGGLICTEPSPNGWTDRLHWEDGRREIVVHERLKDGGLESKRTVLAPDAGW